MRSVGADKIGRYEHLIASKFGEVIPETVKEGWVWLKEWDGVMWERMKAILSDMGVSWGSGEGEGALEGVGMEGGEVGLGGKESGKGIGKENGGASLWTQLALAYAIHKSFIFVRVPAAVAVTPKFVKVLRGWGWNIGKRKGGK